MIILAITVYKNNVVIVRAKLRAVSVSYRKYVKIKYLSVSAFWVVMLCVLVGGYQCFEGTYCLHFKGSNGSLFL
jgi:hypothetical protein